MASQQCVSRAAATLRCLERWLHAMLSTLSRKLVTAAAILYAPKLWRRCGLTGTARLNEIEPQSLGAPCADAWRRSSCDQGRPLSAVELCRLTGRQNSASQQCGTHHLAFALGAQDGAGMTRTLITLLNDKRPGRKLTGPSGLDLNTELVTC